MTEQSTGFVPGHVLIVANQSTVPIVIFGVTITQCENIRQICSGERTKIAIAPGTRRNVGRVEARNPERSYNYRRSFSYHADSSDATAIAALREHGIGVDEVMERPIVRRYTVIDTSAPPGIEKPLSRERITPEERGVRATLEPRDTTPSPTFRFKVAFGSILGSTMMPGAPIQITGPCINPAEAARYECECAGVGARGDQRERVQGGDSRQGEASTGQGRQCDSCVGAGSGNCRTIGV